MFRLTLLLCLLMYTSACAVTEKVIDNALNPTVATFTGIVFDEEGKALCRYQNGLDVYYIPRVGNCSLELHL